MRLYQALVLVLLILLGACRKEHAVQDGPDERYLSLPSAKAAMIESGGNLDGLMLGGDYEYLLHIQAHESSGSVYSSKLYFTNRRHEDRVGISFSEKDGQNKIAEFVGENGFIIDRSQSVNALFGNTAIARFADANKRSEELLTIPDHLLVSHNLSGGLDKDGSNMLRWQAQGDDRFIVGVALSYEREGKTLYNYDLIPDNGRYDVSSTLLANTVAGDMARLQMLRIAIVDLEKIDCRVLAYSKFSEGFMIR